ncbi:DUF1294 domain-containing protein [Sporomusa malonica]|uniref:DUF1294 domain-containing protein n=1 Tax=Sporomusa malonica TaxID=112901 RepID=UPI00352A22E8
MTLLLMLMDKNQAKQGGRRISERALFLCALLFGALGILAGMYTFRHKTKHVSFVIGVPCLLILNLLGYYYI